MKEAILGIIIGALLLWGCFATGPIAKAGMEQLQQQECLSRPWLDTSHGC